MAFYLVTGGGGFIGSNLVEAILRRGDSVRALDNFATGRRENLADVESWRSAGGGTFELLEGDIRDAEVCAAAMRDADFVLHTAAIPSVQRSVLDPEGTNDVNVNGTLRLLAAAREAGVRRFVFSSSSSLYGESEELPKVETMPNAPVSPYGLQKLAGESYTRMYHALYGLPTVALRYFNVFGARQDPNSQYSAVIPRFVTAVKAGERPTIYGDGEQTRDFTYVANVIRANLGACSAGEAALGRAFNIGCGERISLNRLLAGINALAGRKVEAIHEDPRAGDIRHSLASIDAARSALGYEPEVDLERGLELTFGAY